MAANGSVQLEEHDLDYLTGDLRSIAEVVGIEVAVKIGAHFEGTTLHVSLDAVRRAIREAQIMTAYRRGGTVTNVAARFGITRRNVYQIMLRWAERGDGAPSKGLCLLVRRALRDV